MTLRLFSRSPAPDTLSIDRENLHQYYSTVQSEVHPHEQLDQAMARHQARAVEVHRRRRSRMARWPWLGAVLLVLAGGTWALL